MKKEGKKRFLEKKFKKQKSRMLMNGALRRQQYYINMHLEKETVCDQKMY